MIDLELTQERALSKRRKSFRRGCADRTSANVVRQLLEIEKPGADKKVERRRQIDPTTCERDYTADEIEFMRAMDDYKRTSGRQFPTWSEVLEVVRSIGYTRG